MRLVETLQLKLENIDLFRCTIFLYLHHVFYLRNIKAFFTYAEENNLVKKTNIHSIKFLKVNRRPKEQLTDEEYKKLIKVLDLSKFHEFRDFIIINLIFDTGMRLGETLQLKLENIDLFTYIMSFIYVCFFYSSFARCKTILSSIFCKS